MKITIIANGFQVDYMINLLNALARTGATIDFIGSSIYPPEKLDKRINFINLRGDHTESVSAFNKSKRILSYYFRLLKYALQTDSRVFHIQWLRFFISEGILFSLFFRLLGRKVFYTAHDVLPHMKTHVLNKFLFRIIYRCQSGIFVHTGYIKKRLMQEFGLQGHKITVIKHGVYQPDETATVTKDTARNTLGIKSPEIVFLFFGYIAKYKGLDLLLKAYHQLLPEHDNISLIIAGKVEKEYLPVYEKLMDEYRHEKIIPVIRYIQEKEMERLFKASDMVVLPYLEASQSGVLFMAYAFGLPVIAPDLGGFPNDVVAGKTGYLFKTGSYESLREVLRHYILQPFFDKKFIHTYVHENFSWTKTAQDMMEVYK